MSTYKGLVTFTSLLLIVLGIGMLSFTLAHGGGVGLILGTMFVAAGAGRLWLMRRRG